MQDSVMKDMPIFVEAASQKSFTLAAQTLGIPISTLSRRIARMEKNLGVRLFNRNSRTVQLTEAGSIFYERCKFIVAEAKEAREALVHSVRTPAGVVRIAAPADFSRFISDILVEFIREYPNIRLDIYEKSDWSDLMVDGIDLEVRIGELPDSSLVARKLTQFRIGIYSSPNFFTHYPKPSQPKDLLNLPSICLQRPTHWPLEKGTLREDIFIRPIHLFSSMIMVLEFTLAGLGIAALGEELALPFLRQGALVPVLADWTFPEKPVYAVMPSRQMPTRVTLFADFLQEKIRSRGENGAPFSHYIYHFQK